jgi:hypothetical protein
MNDHVSIRALLVLVLIGVATCAILTSCASCDATGDSSSDRWSCDVNEGPYRQTVTVASDACPQEIGELIEGEYEFIVDVTHPACGKSIEWRRVFEREVDGYGSCRFDMIFDYDVYEAGPVDAGESRVGVTCGKEGRDSGEIVCTSGLSVDYELMR